MQQCQVPAPFDTARGQNASSFDNSLRKFHVIDHLSALESTEYIICLYELGIDPGYQFFFKNIYKDQSMYNLCNSIIFYST